MIKITEEQQVEISKFLKHYGKDKQMFQTIEELGELVQSLAKYANIDNPKNTHTTLIANGHKTHLPKGVGAIASETADVLIMLMQIIEMFDIEDVVGDVIKDKILRQQERINK